MADERTSEDELDVPLVEFTAAPALQEAIDAAEPAGEPEPPQDAPQEPVEVMDATEVVEDAPEPEAPAPDLPLEDEPEEEAPAEPEASPYANRRALGKRQLATWYRVDKKCQLHDGESGALLVTFERGHKHLGSTLAGHGVRAGDLRYWLDDRAMVAVGEKA